MRLLLLRFGLSCLVVCSVSLIIGGPVRASGPVERLLQVMVDPSDPQRVVLRFGAASEGFLVSQDGGRTFRATCSTAIAEGLRRVTRAGSLYTPAALMDSQGRVLVSNFDGVWSDDGSGCTWTQEQALVGKRVASMRLDPGGRDVFAIVNSATGVGDSREARAELMRRDVDGSWASVGLLKPHVATQRAFGGDLIAVASGGGRRLYSSLTLSVGPASAPQQTFVVVSDDGGQSWRQGSALPADQETLVLVAADPQQPDRVLALVPRDNAADRLLLSDDQGKTFSAYAELEELSGVTFAPDGRVFLGDAGTGASGAPGGVWTASRLGETLTRLPAPAASDSPNVDCIRYDAQRAALQVCKLDRFGWLDPESGAFEELTRFEAVAELLDCPGSDLLDVCEAQFNEGASWCCGGHFPFSPFCGEYNVTQQNGMPVSCGLAGRAAELAAGRGPTLDAGVADAGASDGGAAAGPDAQPPARDADATTASDAGARRKASGGCALARVGGASAALDGPFVALCALLLVAARRRRAAGAKS